jgi:hypothetical protein
MIIDIGAHLRRLVLAGLPLLAACDPAGQPPQPPPPEALVASCDPRLVVDGTTPGGQGGQTLAIGFARNDPRFADLYETCMASGGYCGRLCDELALAGLKLAPGHVRLSPPHRCELACNQQGEPVATVSFVSGPPPAIGRRPHGFLEVASAEPGTTLAEFFAGCAALEGASIGAFAILAAELEHHGAPPALAARARAAAREEARHFKLTNRLARRFGGQRVRCPRIEARSPRDLAAVALENVVEGCVNETFSAAIALWQADRAGDPAVRAALSGIAADELSHAQLAWDVHAWAAARLGPGATHELTHARAEAVRNLEAAATRPVDAELVATAGLPDAAATTWLAASSRSLWS